MGLFTGDISFAVQKSRGGPLTQVLFLEGMAAAVQNVRPLAEAVANILRKSFAANILGGGRPVTFTPLSVNTLAAKQLKGYPATALVGTGALLSSVSDQSAAGNITRITHGGMQLDVGTNLQVAVWQQEGTSPYTILPKNKKALAFVVKGGKVVTKRVNHPGIPARPFIVVQGEDWTAIKVLIKGWAVGSKPNL